MKLIEDLYMEEIENKELTILDETLLGINEEGFKWFLNKSLTKYAQTEQFRFTNNLPALSSNIVCIRIEKDYITQTYLIFDKKENKILYDCHSFEGCACKVDFMKLNLFEKINKK